FYFLLLSAILCWQSPSVAQDTLRLSYDDFMGRALQNSGQVKFQKQDVNLAENRVDMAKSQRILPNVSLNSQHGFVPAVRSDSVLPWGIPLPEDQYYLDPNLRNDWSDWAFFNKFEVTAVQPLFTWGAINKAIEAARIGAEAAQYSFEAQKADLEVRLFDLYYSYVLAMEIERLLEEAQGSVNQIEEQINELQDEGNGEIDDSDVFQFEIFKTEFEIQKAEVYENLRFVKETWNYVLRNEEGNVFEPEVRFLDPLSEDLEPIDFYQESAFNNRPELKALEAGEEATRTYISSLKKQNLPGLYLAGFINFANTPNRPRQSNPFIQNTTNLFTGGFGFTIRQDLSFFSIKASVERSQIELRKASFAQDAARDGIFLEVNTNYRTAALNDVRVRKTDEALVISKRWLRQEQLDYDFDMGDVTDLIDAMRKELELRLQLKQRVFEYNSSVAELNKSAGVPLTTSISN
ncbi:MAG: TolC family protein, partial [Balneolaceae bacterium]